MQIPEGCLGLEIMRNVASPVLVSSPGGRWFRRLPFPARIFTNCVEALTGDGKSYAENYKRDSEKYVFSERRRRVR